MAKDKRSEGRGMILSEIRLQIRASKVASGAAE